MPDPTHLSLGSPDGRVEVRFSLGGWHAEGAYLSAAPQWQVWFAGRQMLRWSLAGTAPLSGELEVAGAVRHRCRKMWQPAVGDAATLAEHYHELVVRLHECAAPNRRLDLIFRCSNEGAAMRVRVPRQRGVARVTPPGEGAVFRFPRDTLGWITAGVPPAAAAAFGKVPLDGLAHALDGGCSAPLTLNFAHGKLACLLQVGGGTLQLQPTRDGLAAAPVEAPVERSTPCVSPWQVLLLGDKPCDLPQNSGFALRLRAESALPECAPADGLVAADGTTLPFVRYPLWLAGSAARVSLCGQPAMEAAGITPAHRLALELVVGCGAARWDETRFLRGAIGEFVVVARRLGRVWQIGGITGPEGRVLTVRLAEVVGRGMNGTDGADGRYKLVVQRDPLAGEATEGGLVRETFHGVDALDKPRLELLPQGGFLLQLEPED